MRRWKATHDWTRFDAEGALTTPVLCDGGEIYPQSYWNQYVAGESGIAQYEVDLNGEHVVVLVQGRRTSDKLEVR